RLLLGDLAYTSAHDALHVSGAAEFLALAGRGEPRAEAPEGGDALPHPGDAVVFGQEEGRRQLADSEFRREATVRVADGGEREAVLGEEGARLLRRLLRVDGEDGGVRGLGEERAERLGLPGARGAPRCSYGDDHRSVRELVEPDGLA